MTTDIAPAYDDLLHGLRLWRLWLRMGWMDIVRRYRRTTIGPFWTTLGVAAFVGASGFMYSGVFGQDLTDYLPYLTTGFTVWVPLSTFLNECSNAFPGAESTVKQTKLPYSLFIFSGIVRNAIVFAHHLVIYVAVLVLVGLVPNENTLMVLPALVVYVANGVWAGIVVAILCARFRDMQQVVANLLVMIFFMTPIFWPADSVKGRMQSALVDLNVFHHFVDIVRAPMLGKEAQIGSWYIVLLVTVVGWAFAIWLLARYRNRIIFWI
jgi:lipopolysaccharide transport system permease protein